MNFNLLRPVVFADLKVEDAALQALGIHRDPESIATVFSIEHQGVRTVIDVENGKPNVRVEYED